jgi:hypothetical protein
MSSVPNKGSSSSTTTTNGSVTVSIENKATVIEKGNEVTNEPPSLNDEKELALSTTDLESDPATLRKRKRFLGSDPTSIVATDAESSIDLKRKVSIIHDFDQMFKEIRQSKR